MSSAIDLGRGSVSPAVAERLEIREVARDLLVLRCAMPRFCQGLDGSGDVFQLEQDRGQVAIAEYITGITLHGLPEGVPCFAEPADRHEHDAEITMRSGKTRV